jgi:hypothetical protein
MNIRYQADADLNQAIVTGVLRRDPEIDFQTASHRSNPVSEQILALVEWKSAYIRCDRWRDRFAKGCNILMDRPLFPLS